MVLEKLSKEDYDKWTVFLSSTKDRLNSKEFEMICQLHANYFKHKYYKPCTCNPKTILKWIKQITDLYDKS